MNATTNSEGNMCDVHKRLEAELDLDTRQNGVTAPFEPWEGDHTAFVHIVWHAKHRNWNLRDNDADIASAILRSRALATQKAFARRDALASAASLVRDLDPATVTQEGIAAMLDALAARETEG